MADLAKKDPMLAVSAGNLINSQYGSAMLRSTTDDAKNIRQAVAKLFLDGKSYDQVEDEMRTQRVDPILKGNNEIKMMRDRMLVSLSKDKSQAFTNALEDYMGRGDIDAVKSFLKSTAIQAADSESGKKIV
jgi:hypothetical protein